MVGTYADAYEFEHPWHLLTRAIFQKYPNPFASHVLASDVVDRWVDEATGVLYTTRLFLKTNSLPKWARPLFPYSPETYILETSSVDPVNKEMRTRTWNITHTKMMLVEENQFLHPSSTNPGHTTLHTSASVLSRAGSDDAVGTGWLRSRIEGFGVSRFESNTAKSRRGLQLVINQIISPTPIAHPQQQPGQPLLSRLDGALREKTKKIAHSIGTSGTPHVPVSGGAALVGSVGVLGAVVGVAVAGVVWGLGRLGR